MRNYKRTTTVILLMLCCVIALTSCVDAAVFVGAKEPESFVSDDLEELYIDGQRYVRYELPFEILLDADHGRDEYFTYKKRTFENLYVYKHYAYKKIIWLNDYRYYVYGAELSDGISVKVLSREVYYDEYVYCLPEHIEVINKIFDNKSISYDSLTLAYSKYDNLTMETSISNELKEYVLNAREVFLSKERSEKLLLPESVSSLKLNFYCQINDTNIHKSIFSVYVAENGDFFLYNDYYMDTDGYAGMSDTSLEDLHYLIIPNELKTEIDSFIEKAKLAGK